jgi:hypothetical protein
VGGLGVKTTEPGAGGGGLVVQKNEPGAAGGAFKGLGISSAPQQQGIKTKSPSPSRLTPNKIVLRGIII